MWELRGLRNGKDPCGQKFGGGNSKNLGNSKIRETLRVLGAALRTLRPPLFGRRIVGDLGGPSSLLMIEAGGVGDQHLYPEARAWVQVRDRYQKKRRKRKDHESHGG